MLYQLSYEALYNWKQVKSKFNLYLFYEESEMIHVCTYDITHTCTYEQRIKNTSESDPRSYEATKAVAKNGKQRKQGFIAQLVEHHTGIAEVMGLDPVGSNCNCLCCFITTS